jgi:hypothetical protein
MLEPAKLLVLTGGFGKFDAFGRFDRQIHWGIQGI